MCDAEPPEPLTNREDSVLTKLDKRVQALDEKKVFKPGTEHWYRDLADEAREAAVEIRRLRSLLDVVEHQRDADLRDMNKLVVSYRNERHELRAELGLARAITDDLRKERDEVRGFLKTSEAGLSERQKAYQTEILCRKKAERALNCMASDRDEALRSADALRLDAQRLTRQRDQARMECEAVRTQRNNILDERNLAESRAHNLEWQLKTAKAEIERLKTGGSFSAPRPLYMPDPGHVVQSFDYGNLARLVRMLESERSAGLILGDRVTFEGQPIVFHEIELLGLLRGLAVRVFNEGRSSTSLTRLDKISPQADRAFADVCDERFRQEKKWGRQDHDPLYYGMILAEEAGEAAKEIVDMRGLLNKGQPREQDQHKANLRKELIQTAAVAIGFVECLDRNAWTWGS